MSSPTFVGRTEEGNGVYVQYEIRYCDKEAVTIAHRKVDGFASLSISGMVVRKGGTPKRDRDVVCAGQTRGSLADVVTPADGFTLAELARIGEIWDEWHLNDMESHCAHQDKSVKWDVVRECSLTGYRAGTAWLLRELPDDIVTEIHDLLGVSVSA